ncbi:MAG TPA: AAA family ATPase [Blastocatellia bacterium]|nr:AAA family ATPase [Blastocatellia bacterium]
MIKELAIRNFRGFGSLTIQPLSRINLIAGKNNVGKTALLQAILLLQDPLRLLRNFEKSELLPRLPTVGDMKTRWGWLFYETRQDIDVWLRSEDKLGAARTLRLEWELTTNSHESDRLFIKVQDSIGEFDAEIASQQIKTNNITVPLIGEIPSRWVRSPQQNATAFNDLVTNKREDELLSALQRLEPRLRQLRLLIPNGQPTICGDIGIGPFMPLELMGEGIQRILSIVFEIARARQGIVLIDEIENGLHHSVITDVWSVVGEAAKRADVQVFATTHSWECIQSAYQAFEQNRPDDFRLHRLERIKNNIEAVTYDHDSLTGAMQFDFEVR